MSEKMKEVEKMIAKVMKKRDLSRNAAIDYMLGVATGRLSALYRYDESLPEGKTTKGILQLSGRKKRAPKSPKISTLVPASAAAETEKPAKKPAKKRAKKRKKKSDADNQIVIEAAE